MTASVTLSNGDPLPSFMIFNAVTNMLSGFADLIHINTWTLSYVATDAQGISGETMFKLNIYCKLYPVSLSSTYCDTHLVVKSQIPLP